jgi:hypothetical protein
MKNENRSHLEIYYNASKQHRFKQQAMFIDEYKIDGELQDLNKGLIFIEGEHKMEINFDKESINDCDDENGLRGFLNFTNFYQSLQLKRLY